MLQHVVLRFIGNCIVSRVESIQLPEVDQLRCFIAAAETLNFRRAALTVHLTPAALSKQIARLEDRLNRMLFVRTTRSVRLTPDGERLLDRARLALAALARCAERPDTSEQLAGQFTIGSRHELALSWLVPFMQRLSEEHPRFVGHLYVGSGPDLLVRVRSGEVDAAVVSTRIADSQLDFERLHEEQYVFVAAPALLRSNPLRRAHDAAAHTLLDTTRELPLFRYWREGAAPDLELEFSRVLLLGTIAIIRSYVLSGRGVAVLPLYFVRADIARGRLEAVFPKVRLHSDAFRLVFRASDGRRTTFRALASLMRQAPLR